MIDNIWFYTLSTSAQVLSALAGLFAVFVVWKIQEFENSFSEIRLAMIRLLEVYSSNTNGYDKISLETLFSMSDKELLQKFSDLLNIKIKEPTKIAMSATFSTKIINCSLDSFTEKFYKKQVNKKTEIFNILKNILIINFSVISVCILSLTFSSIIPYKFIVLIVISIAVLYCLYLISIGIYKITTK